MALPAELCTLAAHQDGVFLTEQAFVHGLDARALVRLRHEGHLLHPMRGLYAVAATADRRPEGWHRQLAAGAMLLYPDAQLDGVSAVLAHGMPVWAVDLSRPEIMRPIGRSGGVKGLRVRPALDIEPIRTDWGPALPPAWAVVRLAVDHGILQGVVSADAALRSGSTSVEQLRAVAEMVSRWPHAGRVRTLLTLVDARSESVGESILRVELSLRGIRLIPQFEVWDDEGRLIARADFRIDGTRVLIEFDGRMKYASGDPDVLWAEKQREDRLREAGYVVIRVTWAQLMEPARIVARIRRVLAQVA